MRICIVGPIRSGDSPLNIRNAVLAADALLAMGHLPFVPHLCWFWKYLTARDEEDFIAYSMAWLEQCEAVLRLPGESSGADGEVARARELGLPVYYALGEVPPCQP